MPVQQLHRILSPKLLSLVLAGVTHGAGQLHLLHDGGLHLRLLGEVLSHDSLHFTA